MKAIRINPDNTVAVEDTDFDKIRTDMKGWIELIPNLSTHDVAILADEDGKMKGLATNTVASLFAGRQLVGPVWIVGNGVTDDFDDVPQDAVDSITLFAAQC